MSRVRMAFAVLSAAVLIVTVLSGRAVASALTLPPAHVKSEAVECP